MASYSCFGPGFRRRSFSASILSPAKATSSIAGNIEGQTCLRRRSPTKPRSGTGRGVADARTVFPARTAAEDVSHRLRLRRIARCLGARPGACPRRPGGTLGSNALCAAWVGRIHAAAARHRRWTFGSPFSRSTRRRARPGTLSGRSPWLQRPMRLLSCGARTRGATAENSSTYKRTRGSTGLPKSTATAASSQPRITTAPWPK